MTDLTLFDDLPSVAPEPNECRVIFGHGPSGATCKTCKHLHRGPLGHSKVWYKCDLRRAGGPATDHRVGWLACGRYDDGTFDYDAGLALAEKGCDDALSVQVAWSLAADDWLAQLDPGEQFTADDLVAAVGLPDGSHNAVGAWVRGSAAGGRIADSGTVRKATRVASRTRRLVVWCKAGEGRGRTRE